MSELETLKSHALAMAERDHASTCPAKVARPSGLRGARCDDALSKSSHEPHRWSLPLPLTHARDPISLTRWCAGYCTGCMTDTERGLWRQIATEIGTHLEQPAEAEQEALPL